MYEYTRREVCVKNEKQIPCWNDEIKNQVGIAKSKEVWKQYIVK